MTPQRGPSPAVRMFLAVLISALVVYPQTMQLKTAWLLRLSLATSSHWGQVWDVNLGFMGITSTGEVALAALSFSLFLNSDQAWDLMDLFSPLFCAGFLPGLSLVPLEERNMFSTFRSSMTTRS